jgi:hypothetical protein
MITPQELRIGNYLYDTETGFKGDFQVTAGDILDIAKNGIQTFKPIPLSPEILEKCGFTQKTGAT